MKKFIKIAAIVIISTGILATAWYVQQNANRIEYSSK